jgi:hypothetical protein
MVATLSSSLSVSIDHDPLHRVRRRRRDYSLERIGWEDQERCAKSQIAAFTFLQREVREVCGR